MGLTHFQFPPTKNSLAIVDRGVLIEAEENGFWFFSFGFHFSVADFVLNFWSFYLWQRIKQGAINLWEIDLLF
jgi:hypothetical protein